MDTNESAFLRTKALDYLAEGGTRGVKEFITTRQAMQSEDSLASLESKGHSRVQRKKSGVLTFLHGLWKKPRPVKLPICFLILQPTPSNGTMSPVGQLELILS